MNNVDRAVTEYGWWLASRASGLVALVLVTISVAIGLTMASKLARRPGNAPHPHRDPRADRPRRD